MNNISTTIRRILRPYGDNQRRPVVTIALIVACVVTELATRASDAVAYHLVFAPFLAEVEPYRFLTSAFMHSGFWHLALNMYALWILGSVLEPLLGRWRFTALYMLSALAGNTAVLLLAAPSTNDWFTGTVGASGAVFGLLGAQIVVARLSGADLTNLIVVVALNLMIGFMPGSGISWESHIGGFIMGVVAVWLIARTYKLRGRARTAADAGILVGLLGVLVLEIAVF